MGIKETERTIKEQSSKRKYRRMMKRRNNERDKVWKKMEMCENERHKRKKKDLGEKIREELKRKIMQKLGNEEKLQK